MHKMLPKMGNVFQKDNLVAERNVVEQDEVLVQLPHIANVRYDGHAKLAAKQTHRNEFTDASHASRIHLDESRASGQQIILEDDAVRDVFPNRQPGGSDCVGEGLVAEHVIRVRWLLDPKRSVGSSIQNGLMALNCRQMSSAWGKVHCWFASNITRALAPATSRTIFARRRSRSESREPTLSFIAVNPAAIARLQFSRTWSSS